MSQKINKKIYKSEKKGKGTKKYNNTEMNKK